MSELSLDIDFGCPFSDDGFHRWIDVAIGNSDRDTTVCEECDREHPESGR